MAKLEHRLQALEARAPKADPEHDRRFNAAIKALFDAASARCEWAPSKVAPLYHVEQPSPMARLLERIKAGTLTGDDRAMLDGLPVCHVPPEKLVEAVMQVQAMI